MTVKGSGRLVMGCVVIGVLAACARGAPELPADYGSVDTNRQLDEGQFSLADQKLTCKDLRKEFDTLKRQETAHENEIKGNRGDNQAAGYVAGVLFPPALLATKHNEKEKTALDAIQKRRDTLFQLVRFRNCPAA